MTGPVPCGAPDAIAPETSHVLEAHGDRAIVRLAAVDDATGSGVARTDHRVDGGPVAAYARPFAVTGAGPHVVEYRSADRAGNAEPFRRIELTLGAPRPGAPPRGGGSAPPPPPAGAPPRGGGEPRVRLLGPHRRRVALRTFARRGLRVRVACIPATVVRLVLRGRGRTIARRTAACDGRRVLRLRPRKGAARALRRAGGTVRATLRVRAPGAPAISGRVTLR